MGLLRISTICLATLALLTVGCAPKTKVLDYSTYPQLPMSLPTKAFRLVTRTPLTRDALYYGRYGGTGSKAGKPIDALDEIFRQHDIAYDEATEYKQVIEADEAMVEDLRALNVEALGPKAVRFRDKAIKFFTSKTGKWLGKPLVLILGKTREPRCINIDDAKAEQPEVTSGSK